jgi:hypothetical protein
MSSPDDAIAQLGVRDSYWSKNMCQHLRGDPQNEVSVSQTLVG